MNKLYDRVDWVNNTTPALNQTNLNKMSKALDDLDDRVVDIAGTVMETVPQIQEDLAEAAELVQDAEAITTHPPIIGQNGNWWTWDTSIDAYADSGVDAGVSLTVGSTMTLPAGSSATVTNSGTATDPVLNFGIPQGAAGQNGTNGQDGADGVSPAVTIGSITGGHSVTITDKDHPSGQSFNVMDGADGQDGQDGVGVPPSGTTGQVLKKRSNADYDTEWANESGGGSSGHTILNSSGTAMTARSKLQFNGMSVTDDSGNDKTVVTPYTPDYVDEQFNPATTYSKGMTCISGNKRYEYINNTPSSGHQPPDATYWVEESVSSEIKNKYRRTSTPYVIGYIDGNPITRYYKRVYHSELTADQISALNGTSYASFDSGISASLVSSGYQVIVDPMSNWIRDFWGNASPLAGMTLSGVSSPSISIYTDNSFSNGNFAIKLKQTLTTNVTAGSGRFEFWYDLIKIS